MWGAAAGQLGSKVGQQAAMSGVMNNIFANMAVTPAATNAIQSMGTDALLTGGVEAGNQIGMDAILKSTMAGNQGLVGHAANGLSKATPFGTGLMKAGTNPSLFSQAKELLGSKAFTNSATLLKDGYSIYDQMQARKDAKQFQDQNMAMMQGTYDRNKAADERRQNLVF